MALDNESLSFIKEWLLVPAAGLAAWAWKINDKEHDAMRAAHSELKKQQESLQTNTSNGYSVLNDRVMEYIDGRVDEVKREGDKRFERTNEHITKLFENAEKDRATFREANAAQAELNSRRHIELLQAIHTGLAGKADKEHR